MNNEGAQKPQKYFLSTRREMLPFIPTNVARILEIGCGDGLFAAEIRKLRSATGDCVKLTGVEIEPIHAEFAKRHHDRVVVANIETDEIPFQNGEFDCIICNDVLEHLVDPWEALSRLRTYLEPGGLFVASIPNIRYWGVLKDLLFEGDWRYQAEGVLDRTHLRFFTKKSISKLFLETGFDTVQLMGINSHVRGLKFQLLNLLTRDRFDDIQYMQFAVTARKSLD